MDMSRPDFRSCWRKTTLGDMFEIMSSKRVLQSQWKKNGVPFYRAREIVKLARDGFVDNDLFISDEHFRQLSKTSNVPTAGDLMVSAVGTLGACYEVRPNDRFYYKDASVLLFRPRIELANRFMQYAFLSPELLSQVNSGQGATVGTFTIKRARETDFWLPPLDEQKRIVALLDQAFAALDRAGANAEANLADTEALFDAWLTSVFHDHPRSWQTEKLRSLCSKITVGHVGPMVERYTEHGIPFLRSQNIRPFEISLDNVKLINADFHGELAKSALMPGDVAIVRTGYPGTAAVIPETLPVSNCADLVIARPKPSIAPGFLVMFLNSTLGKQMVAAKAVGAAQKHFNVGAAKDVDFSFPRITEQERLVRQARGLRAQVKGAEESYRAKLADIAALRQSLLQAAFSGQLT